MCAKLFSKSNESTEWWEGALFGANFATKLLADKNWRKEEN